MVTFQQSAAGKGGVSYENVAQLGAARRALGDSVDEWRRELDSSLPMLASEDNASMGHSGFLYEEDLEDPDLPQDGPETQVLGLPSDLEWEDGTGDPILIRAALAEDRKSTRLNSSHSGESRMPSSA